ncbi:probable 2-ketogluconate reductase [Lytechinus variegatus]|uniref:probable 2-ketogluconate reductase n=1 Tax=Lytechinus variegatus TaxID=7654 RepID=UPI001BB120F2|nr:probable 2-ketogluconate reductase [Lytechinus variegatus]
MADERWILSVISEVSFTASPHLKRLREDYNIVFLTDFDKDRESFYDKLKVIILSPADNGMEINEEFLRKSRNLKALVTISTGISHIDIPLLRKFNVKVYSVSGSVTAETTADQGFLLMMMASRRIMEFVEVAKTYTGSSVEEEASTSWEVPLRLIGHDVHHATLGIVGMGWIGFEVAKRAKGFQMKVLYHNRHRRDDDVEVGATYCPTLEDLLPHVDYLMLTPPLTEETRGMMGRDQMKLMKASAIIINVSRGPIIVTDDLVQALKDGTIGGAALDVTDPEPLPINHPLLHMPNVIISPHVGMYTREGIARITSASAEDVRTAMDGGE